MHEDEEEEKGWRTNGNEQEKKKIREEITVKKNATPFLQ
jgi:hypothetical protein